jgi:hypothetical protein
MTDADPSAFDGQIRDVENDDLESFFAHQLDPEALRMAAFKARDRASFMAHWAKIRADETVVAQTIVVDGRVVGNVVSWEQSSRPWPQRRGRDKDRDTRRRQPCSAARRAQCCGACTVPVRGGLQPHGPGDLRRRLSAPPERWDVHHHLVAICMGSLAGGGHCAMSARSEEPVVLLPPAGELTVWLR